MAGHKTSALKCRQKMSYPTEERALRALYDVQEKRSGEYREQRAYPCNAYDANHWHLTTRPVNAQGETARYIQHLERTVLFLLREIERARRGGDQPAG